jgi:hypothetical protein
MDDKVKLKTFMNASEEECVKLDQPEQFILQVRERERETKEQSLKTL